MTISEIINSAVDPYLDKFIPLYRTRKETGQGTLITVRQLFDGIINDERWRKYVLNARAEYINDPRKTKRGEEPTKFEKAKNDANAVILAGTVIEKAQEEILEPTGLLAMDLDKLGPLIEKVKAKLRQDPYVYAFFESFSGGGLCVIFKVDFARYKEAFEGIREYLINEYGFVNNEVDSSVKNLNRLRYISHYPDLFYNREARIARIYVKKAEAKKYTPDKPIIDTERDMEYVVRQFEERRIELHDTGRDWVRVGLAIASKYDTAGLDYFQRVSQFRHDYDPQDTEKVYQYLCRQKRGDIKIATFYFIAKANGCDIMTAETREVVSVTAMQKKQGFKEGDCLRAISQMIPNLSDDTADIVKQVYASREGIDTEEDVFDQLKNFLRHNYPMRRNIITRNIVNESEAVYEEETFNSIYFEAKKVVDKDISFADFNRMIMSDFVPNFDPFADWLRRNENYPVSGKAFSRLLATMIGSNTKPQPKYVSVWLRKWFLGIIETMLGAYCEIVFIQTGAMNAGKTRWFRGLLPEELRKYWGESELDKGQDDEILMTKKLVLFNDEFGGQTRRNANRFKNLTAKHTFSIREPYGRSHKDLRRIAVFCGTSNERDLVTDWSGVNRRIVPVEVNSVDWDLFQSIDKTELFIEVYNWYKAGERSWSNKEEIALLESSIGDYKDIVAERELILRYYSLPGEPRSKSAIFLQPTDIKIYIQQRTNDKVVLKKITEQLNSLGFVYVPRKVQGVTIRGYWVVQADNDFAGGGDEELDL